MGQYSPGSRANRAGASPDAALGGGVSAFSVAFSSIAAILDTETTSRSRARPQAVSVGAGAVALDEPQQPIHLTHPRPRQIVIQHVAL